jgi:hypothetical protein
MAFFVRPRGLSRHFHDRCRDRVRHRGSIKVFDRWV